jgi:group I intron endonuclease
MFIYLIVNHITGKYYVGQHKGNNLKKYFQTKLSDAFKNRGGRSYLYASMRKHGREAFTIHALLSDIQTRPELDAYEKDFIAFLKSQDPEYGYNICRGGEGFTGPFSIEHRAKLSAAAKINCNYLKAAQAAEGVARSADVRARISAARFGYRQTSSTKEKLRLKRLLQPDPRLGTHHSKATKKRISDAKKGTPSPFRGRHHTDESKERNRQAHLKHVQEETNFRRPI